MLPHCTIPVLAALMLATGAQAQLGGQPIDEPVPETTPEVIEEWVEQLGNPDWLMRDLATLELAELDPGISLETLEGYMRHEDLSHEQRARLRLACLRRFALRPKGALGVSFGTIRVGSIQVQPIPPSDEFPASRMLMENDEIAMVGERVIDGSFALRVEILSREPGSILPVTLIRNERVLHLDLPLGSFSNLTGAVRMDSQLLADSLALRWERLGIDTASDDSVGEGLSIEDWVQAAFPDGEAPDPREPELIAPRGFVLGPGMNTTPGAGRWGQAIIDVWSDTDTLERETMQRRSLLAGERVQPLIALRMMLERERDQLTADLEQAGPDEREALIAQRATLASRLDQLNTQIERTRSLD